MDEEVPVPKKSVEQLLRESRELRERAERLEKIAADLARRIADRDARRKKKSD